MKQKCEHNILIKINHWWFRIKCKKCNKRFRNIPKGEYYTWKNF